VLGGTAIERPQLTGFLNSDFDPFLNQLFATGPVTPREAADALEGQPGFIWLAEEPSPSKVAVPEVERLSLAVLHGMTAKIALPVTAPQIEGEIVEVRSRDELQAWHEVLCEVFGVDDRSRHDWQRVQRTLGPSGDGSLSLLLARVDGSPAATGAVYLGSDVAGLYCFTTREQMRGRGLASALVHACHKAAQARGFERAVLQAGALGQAGLRQSRIPRAADTPGARLAPGATLTIDRKTRPLDGLDRPRHSTSRTRKQLASAASLALLATEGEGPDVKAASATTRARLRACRLRGRRQRRSVRRCAQRGCVR
jgi:ribosomal protein S18 acetylase RimI-like enzyme